MLASNYLYFIKCSHAFYLQTDTNANVTCSSFMRLLTIIITITIIGKRCICPLPLFLRFPISIMNDQVPAIDSFYSILRSLSILPLCNNKTRKLKLICQIHNILIITCINHICLLSSEYKKPKNNFGRNFSLYQIKTLNVYKVPKLPPASIL